MKLGDILRQGRNRRPCVPRRTTFTATILDEQTRRGQDVDVDAALGPLNEEDRELALIAARRGLRERHPEAPLSDLPPTVLSNEETYQILARALRIPEPNTDGMQPPLFDTVDDLRSAINFTTARDLYAEYERYMEEEYPPAVDDATFEDLIKEAEGKSLRALRSDFASMGADGKTRLLSSILRFMRSPMATSGAGAR